MWTWTDDEVDSRLYKRGGIYYVRDRRGNLDAKRSLRTRSRREARERGREWLKSRDHLFGGERRVTWADAVTTWAGDYLPDAVKPSTAKRYLVSEAQISAFIAAEARKRGQADLYVDQIDTKLALEYRRVRRRAGVNIRTLKRDMTAWGYIMSTAVAEGWRHDNPIQAIDRQLMRAKHRPIVLPPMDEVRALVERAGPMLGALVDTLWRTGMRLEECAGLQHEHWSRDGIQLCGDATKTSEARFIPLNDPQDPDWMRAAAGTLAGTPRRLNSPWVFWHGEGERYSTASNSLSRLRKELGFVWKTHDLRHLFAVLYLRHFMPNPRQALYRLQQIMGHASIKQTEEYLKFVGPDVHVIAGPDAERDQKREQA